MDEVLMKDVATKVAEVFGSLTNVSADDFKEVGCPGRRSVFRKVRTFVETILNDQYYLNPAMAEIVDWKTGRRADFAAVGSRCAWLWSDR